MQFHEAVGYVLTAVLSMGITIISALAKREFNRIDKNFDILFGKLDSKMDRGEYYKYHDILEAKADRKVDAELCRERRATCDPCRKTVSGLTEDMSAAINCINKHVDNCDI